MIVEPSQAPVLRFVGARGYAEDFELRMRMSATGRCVDAAAALVGSGGLHVSEEAKAASGFGLSLRERYDGRRWGLRCRAL